MIFSSLAFLIASLTPALAASESATAGLVMIDGAKISPQTYDGLLKSIQEAYPGNLLVNAPSFFLELPIPFFTTNIKIGEAVASIRQKLPADAPVFIAGHSLGGIAAQEFVESHKNEVNGLILMGSGLLRKRLGSFSVPTLHVNGQLDAQYKPMRSAEAYFRSISPFPRNNAVLRTPDAMTNFPVVMVPNVTHMSFATYNKPPKRVVELDLYPTITEDEAHKSVAEVISSFLTVHTNSIDSTKKQTSASLLKTRVQASGIWLAPMLEAMEQEASKYLKPIADPSTISDNDRLPIPPANPDPNVWSSSPLAADVQIAIANLSSTDFKLETRDALLENPRFKAVFEADKNCTQKPCRAKAISVSWNVYEKNEDRALFVSAEEIRMKMKSNQFVRSVTSNDAPRDLLETDPLTFCRDQNQRIFDQTYAKLPQDIRRRYDQFGAKFVFVEDKRVQSGRDWVPAPLEFTLTSQGTVEVRSITLITPLSVPILGDKFAGQHYCKIISPARIVEWIYSDGLRPQLGLANKALANKPGAIRVNY